MELLKRRDAKKIGSNKYFTGKPCPKGHIVERWVVNCHCVSCHAQGVGLYEKTDARKDHVKKYLLKNNCSLKYNNAKKRALKEGVPFTITIQDIKDAFPVDGKCPALGTALEEGRNRDNLNNAPTLVRKKCSLGYTPENICIISYKAAKVKSVIDDPVLLQSMAQWLKNI